MNLFTNENIQWLKKQLWFWILVGIMIMSSFFYVAKGLIVFIGGTFLGLYLYNIYGNDSTMLNNTFSSMKSGFDKLMKR